MRFNRLWELYHGRLGLVEAPRSKEVWVRTSMEDHTMQIAGAMLGAMGTVTWPWAVYTRPSSVRALCFLPLGCVRADTPADRLARAGVHVSRRQCNAQRVQRGASVEHLSESARLKARRCRVQHCGARRMAQLKYVVPPIHTHMVSHSCGAR